jgi:DnaD/phage-associated family protein
MGKINIKFNGGSFSVYNSFVDKFIKEANPSYIKVYLYMIRHISAGNSFSLTKISSETGLIKSDVISAFKYWADAGVISYNDNPDNIEIGIVNLDAISQEERSNDPAISSDDTEAVRKEETPNQNSGAFFQPNESVSSSYKSSVVVKAIHDDEKLAHLFSIIQQMLNKNLSSNDYKIIYSFIDYLKLPEQVIIILFEYCISLNKTNMRYIEKIAYSWADNGINTIALAEQYISRKNEHQKMQAYYKSKFKISGRDLSDTELKYLTGWVYDLKVSEEVILAAFEKTVLNTGKISFKYMDAIIRGEAKTPAEKSSAKSTFKNYPAKYEISDKEKSRLERMMLEYEDGE